MEWKREIHQLSSETPARGSTNSTRGYGAAHTKLRRGADFRGVEQCLVKGHRAEAER